MKTHLGSDQLRGLMSTVNDVIVSYGGDSKRYSRDFQTKEEFKKSWYAVLSRAHASVEAKVSCACKGKGPKSLAVKYHSGGDTYFWHGTRIRVVNIHLTVFSLRLIKTIQV